MPQIIMPELHPAQVEVQQHRARFKVLACGRRFGNTRLGALLVIACALAGGAAWWVEPYYPTASIGWKDPAPLPADSGGLYPGSGQAYRVSGRRLAPG